MKPDDQDWPAASDADFLSSAAGQFIAGAHTYLVAAKTLRYSQEFESRPSILVRPILHLVAHGCELLLKFPLLWRGTTEQEIQSEFGHDLRRLWTTPANEPLVAMIRADASKAWAKASEDGKLSVAEATGDPLEELERALIRLTELHGRHTRFGLRYGLPPTAIGPRPAYLIDALSPSAERLAKNPLLLDRQLSD